MESSYLSCQERDSAKNPPSPLYNSTNDSDCVDVIFPGSSSTFLTTKQTTNARDVVKSWKLFVVLANYKSAKAKHDLSKLSEHFYIEMPPPPIALTFGAFVHNLQLQMGLPYEFPLIPTTWDSSFSRYVRLTQASMSSTLDVMFNLITSGQHLTADGRLRGTCCINLIVNYDDYSRFEKDYVSLILQLSFHFRHLKTALTVKRERNKKARQRKSANKKLSEFKDYFHREYARVIKSML